MTRKLLSRPDKVRAATLCASLLALAVPYASGPTANAIEAAIAAFHSTATGALETDWSAIASLYDTLMSVRPTPIVALNRAIAIAQMAGPERGLAEIAAIADRERLSSYPFYHAAVGELEFRRGRYAEARERFKAAVAMARNPMERSFLERRVSACANSCPEA